MALTVTSTLTFVILWLVANTQGTTLSSNASLPQQLSIEEREKLQFVCTLTDFAKHVPANDFGDQPDPSWMQITKESAYGRGDSVLALMSSAILPEVSGNAAHDFPGAVVEGNWSAGFLKLTVFNTHDNRTLGSYTCVTAYIADPADLNASHLNRTVHISENSTTARSSIPGFEVTARVQLCAWCPGRCDIMSYEMTSLSETNTHVNDNVDVTPNTESNTCSVCAHKAAYDLSEDPVSFHFKFDYGDGVYTCVHKPDSMSKVWSCKLNERPLKQADDHTVTIVVTIVVVFVVVIAGFLVWKYAAFFIFARITGQCSSATLEEPRKDDAGQKCNVDEAVNVEETEFLDETCDIKYASQCFGFNPRTRSLPNPVNTADPDYSVRQPLHSAYNSDEDVSVTLN